MFEGEAVWKKLLEATCAPVDVVDAVAGGAMEVVMVPGGHGGRLVAIGPAGHAHRGDLIVLLELPHHPIDRPHAQSGHRRAGGLVDLLDREWPACVRNRGLDRPELSGGTLLGHV